MSLKQIEVSVLHRSSHNQKILIELSVSTAKKLIDGHENLNNVMRDDIKRAVKFAEQLEPKT